MPNLLPSTFSSDDLLSDDRLHRLAHELARNLLSPEDVLASFGITPELFQEKIRMNETFTRYYTESYALWHGVSNLPERVKAKAAMMFEEFLPEAHRIIHDPACNLPPKVQLAMFIAEIGGLKPQQNAAGVGANGGPANNKVHVTINLNHGRQIVIEKKLEPTIEGEAVDITPAPAAINTPTTQPIFMGEPTPPPPPPPSPPKPDLSHTPIKVPVKQPKPRAPSVRIIPTEL